MIRLDIHADTLAVFDRREDRYEPLTTPEVADALGVGRRTVYERLRTPVDRGDLRTKATGSNARVWWRPPTTGRQATGTRYPVPRRGPTAAGTTGGSIGSPG
jgi:hypothetical protein